MNVDQVKKDALNEIKNAETANSLEDIRVKYLGRKDGKVNTLLRSLKDLSASEKRKQGPKLQELKTDLEEALNKKKEEFSKGTTPKVDLTAPGKRHKRGYLHPLTIVEEEVRQVFKAMNFSIISGPEVESEYYNFDALNIPPDHPARDMWDTFWIKDAKDKDHDSKMLLRTHTSPVQVRYMEAHEPPFQIMVPGRTFRYEATDASHETNFHQIEALMVGKDVNLANFKFVVEEFFNRFFGNKKVEFRYRPSYFPFTEPSLEVDIKLGGKWLEVMGAGMVHPRVFEYAHYNPKDWQGFAFGGGLERLAMIKYNIPDIRMFYSGDVRFIKQFS